MRVGAMRYMFPRFDVCIPRFMSSTILKIDVTAMLEPIARLYGAGILFATVHYLNGPRDEWSVSGLANQALLWPYHAYKSAFSIK